MKIIGKFMYLYLLILLGLMQNCTPTGKNIRVSTVEELQQAVLEADSNVTVLIADGTYPLKQSLIIDHKNHLTLRGESGDAAKVILQGGGWGDFYNGPRESLEANDVIVIRNSEDITISDLTVAEASHYGIKLDAETEAVTSNPNNIHILRCNFMNIGTRGVKGTKSKNGKQLLGGSVRFCNFENTKILDTSGLFNGDYISGIDMMCLTGWEFSDNHFKNIKGANGGARGAIFIWVRSHDVLVERNVFIGCDRSIAFGNPHNPEYIESGMLHNYGGIIRNNFIIGDTEQSTGIEVAWTDNVQVCHNTIYGPGMNYSAIRYTNKINRLLISNNLVRGRIYGEGDVRLEGNVPGDLDGYFVNPATGDLHLTASASEALGKVIKLSIVQEDIDGQKRKDNTDVGADQK